MWIELQKEKWDSIIYLYLGIIFQEFPCKYYRLPMLFIWKWLQAIILLEAREHLENTYMYTHTRAHTFLISDGVVLEVLLTTGHTIKSYLLEMGDKSCGS